MKHLIIGLCVLTGAVASADEWIPAADAPQTGSRVVIQDKTYVLFSEEDYATLTNKMDFLVSVARKRWTMQHANESGRVAWHGRAQGQAVTTNAAGRLERVITYADGYRHVEEAELKRKHVQTVRDKARALLREQKRSRYDVPERLRKAREGVSVEREVK